MSEPIVLSRFVSHRARVSGEFDSGKIYNQQNFWTILCIFVGEFGVVVFWCWKFFANCYLALYFVEMSIIFKPSFDLGSWTVSNNLFVGISSNDLSLLWHKESRFSLTQVPGMSAFKCSDNLHGRYLLYKFNLLFE